MHDPTDDPVVYTKLGNMYERELEKWGKWERHGDNIVFSKTWTYQGEVVKREAHVYIMKGLSVEAFQEPIAQPAEG